MRKYYIDLNLTDNCNFKCVYCNEEFDSNRRICNISDNTIHKFKTFVRTFIKSKFFTENFDYLMIAFWGGEPTLKLDVIQDVISEFENDNRINFFIYTNGYEYKKLLNLVSKYKDTKFNNEWKVITQISYDGDILQKKNRKHKSDNNSADIVKNAIYEFIDSNIPFTMKATIRPDDFNHLYDSYLDYKKIYDYGNTKNNKSCYTFAPTIDYFTNNGNDINFESNICSLKHNLIKIAQIDKDNLFTWFHNNAKQLCAVGCSMCCIDINGDIYKCHGALYSELKNDHFINNINNDDVIESLNTSYMMHKIHTQTDPCTGCFSTICLRCNTIKYSLSNKLTYIEKFTDYKNQPKICEFYKLASIVKLARDRA